VLFSDLSGSSRLGHSTEPEILDEVLRHVKGAAFEVIERYGGIVVQFQSARALFDSVRPELERISLHCHSANARRLSRELAECDSTPTPSASQLASVLLVSIDSPTESEPLLSPSDSTYSKAYVVYAIGLVFLVSVFNVIDRYILSVLAPGIKDDLGLSDTQMGLLLGPSFSVVHFLAVLPAAWLADRYGRRTVVALGLLVWSGMTSLGAGASNFTQLFITRMGVGIGEAAGSPPSVGLLSDTAPAAWRTRALSAITVGALVGVAAGMIAGGYVGQNHGWRVALLVVGLPGVVLALVVRLTLREPPRKEGPGPSPVAAASHLFELHSFRWAVGGACVSNIAIAGRNLWEPSFLDRSYGLSGAELGLVYVMISAAPSAIGALVGASLTDRLAKQDLRWLAWICAGSIGFGAPFLIGFLLWSPDHVVNVGGVPVPVAFSLSAIGSFFLGAFSPPMASLAQAVATAQMRSLAHAIWTMPYTLIGMGVGPLLVGSLSEHWSGQHGSDSLRIALIAASLLLPIGAVGFTLAGRDLRRDIEHVNHLE
jgi:MFS family permease